MQLTIHRLLRSSSGRADQMGSVVHGGLLPLPHAGIGASLLQQSCVRAVLNDPPFIKHHNLHGKRAFRNALCEWFLHPRGS